MLRFHFYNPLSASSGYEPVSALIKRYFYRALRRMNFFFVSSTLSVKLSSVAETFHRNFHGEIVVLKSCT